jgi:hypothetical protein
MKITLGHARPLEAVGVVIAQKIMLMIFDDGPLEAVPYVSASCAGLASDMH